MYPLSEYYGKVCRMHCIFGKKMSIACNQTDADVYCHENWSTHSIMIHTVPKAGHGFASPKLHAGTMGRVSKIHNRLQKALSECIEARATGARDKPKGTFKCPRTCLVRAVKLVWASTSGPASPPSPSSSSPSGTASSSGIGPTPSCPSPTNLHHHQTLLHPGTAPNPLHHEILQYSSMRLASTLGGLLNLQCFSMHFASTLTVFSSPILYWPASVKASFCRHASKPFTI